MTIDEHIHKAEEDAKMAEFDTVWGIGNYFIDRSEALEYAKECRQLVEWLKDYKRLKEQEPSGDLISREAVLDTISELNAISFYEAQEDSKECYYELRQAIKDLPPVKQEPKTEKDIKMRDATPEEQEAIAKYIKSISKPTGVEFDIDIDKKVESYGKLLKHPVIKSIMDMDETPVTLSVSENPNNCDLISRDAVEEIINDIRDCISVEGYWAILERLKKLPSVKPQEPKTGHWILKIEDWNKWICSKCGYTERTDIHVSLGYDFCPKCGAKMSENPTGSKDVIWYNKRNYSEIVVEPQEGSEV